MNQGNKIYFVSDLHLGAPSAERSLPREKHFISWLDQVRGDASDIYLVGDVFDFWFEYKHAVPRGYIRLLGKLAELADEGIRLHVFTGNHDIWYKDYFPSQIGAQVYSEPLIAEHFGKKFYIGHGDGLGPGDHGYKFLKWLLSSSVIGWFFGILHPNIGIGLAYYFSGLSKSHNYDTKHHQPLAPKKANEDERLYIHSQEILKTHPDMSYFIYGHRHVMYERELGDGAGCFILGDWIEFFSYLEVSEQSATLKQFPIQALVAEQQ